MKEQHKMKLATIKSFVAATLVAVGLGALTAMAKEETVMFSEMGLADGAQSVQLSRCAINFSKGTAAFSAPTYNSSTGFFGCASGNSFTFDSEDDTITSIVLKFAESDSVFSLLKITANNGSYQDSGSMGAPGIWTGSASSITFSVGGWGMMGTTRLLAGVTVTYEDKTVEVTLPATTGYGFVVSNLTESAEAEIKPTEDGGLTYKLPIGAKVGIYAVAEEGYVVTGEPYIIEEVTSDTKIEESKLPKAEELMQIYAKTLMGDQLTLEVTPNYSILTVKKMIAKELDIQVSQISRLVFSGKQLADGKTLSEYNIPKESTIHVILTQRQVEVTLPTTTGYGFVVSNLTEGAVAEIKPIEDGGLTYKLSVGTKVGIYAVAEEGYVVTGEPYIIEEVTSTTTIDESKLPRAEKIPVLTPGDTAGPFTSEDEARSKVKEGLVIFEPTDAVAGALKDSAILSVDDYKKMFKPDVYKVGEGDDWYVTYVLTEDAAKQLDQSIRAVVTGFNVAAIADASAEGVTLTPAGGLPGFYYTLFKSGDVTTVRDAASYDKANCDKLCGKGGVVTFEKVTKPTDAAGFFAVGVSPKPRFTSGEGGTGDLQLAH